MRLGAGEIVKLVLALLFLVVIFLFYGVCFWLGLSMNKNEGCGAINNDFAIGMVLGPFTMLAMHIGQIVVQAWAKVVAARRNGFSVYVAMVSCITFAVRPPFERPRFHLLHPSAFIVGKEQASVAEMKALNRAVPIASFAMFAACAIVTAVLFGRREAALLVTFAQFGTLSFGVWFWQMTVSNKAPEGFRDRERQLKTDLEPLSRAYWQTWFHYETLLQPIPEVRLRLQGLNPAADQFSRAAHLVLSTHLDILDGRDAEALDRLRANHDWLMQYPTEFDVAASCLSAYAGLEAVLGNDRAKSDAIYEFAAARNPDLPSADALRFAAAGDYENAEAKARIVLSRTRNSNMPIFASMEALMHRYMRPGFADATEMAQSTT